MTDQIATPLPVFHDRDCDLSIIRGQRVAVIGYGSQGRTHALNLRDSGVADIVVGLKSGSATRAKAEADGFPVLTAGEAAAGADVAAVMVSDEAHRDLWRDELAPTMKPGAALVFAHGLSVRFGLVQPRADLDVILASPKGIGPRIRDLYVEGQGVFALFGGSSGRDRGGSCPWPVLCRGLGLWSQGYSRDHLRGRMRKRPVRRTGGALRRGRRVDRRRLHETGQGRLSAEVAWFECFYEVKLVTDLMFERGIAGAFAKISNTAEYGAYLTGPRIIGEPSRAAMDDVLTEVRDGSFVKRLMADYDAGSPDLLARRKALGDRTIEAVGAHLNAVAARAVD